MDAVQTTPHLPPTPLPPAPAQPTLPKPIDSQVITLAENLEISLPIQREWVGAWARRCHPTQLLGVAEAIDAKSPRIVLDPPLFGVILGLARLGLTQALTDLCETPGFGAEGFPST